MTNTRNKAVVWFLSVALMFTMGFGNTLQFAHAAEPEQQDREIAEMLEDDTFVTEETSAYDEIVGEESVKGNAEQTDPDKSATDTPTTEPTTEENSDGLLDGSFSKADYVAYNPLYVKKYADKKYVNTDNMVMESFVVPVSVGKGVATYNVEKQKDFDVSASNYISGVTYEVPFYDVDKDSDYYVALPDVNMNDANLKSYDIMVAYNNNHAEELSDFFYDRDTSILYVAKKYIDSPKNKESLDEGKSSPIAVQMNYYFKNLTEKDGNAVFAKTFPAMVLSNGEEKSMEVKTNSLFDTYISVKTGVKGAKDVSVFLNGTLFPVKDDAFAYDPSTGEVVVSITPAVVSSVNIVMDMPNTADKAKSWLKEAFVPSALASVSSDKVVSQKKMKVFKTKSKKYVTLEGMENMYVGWRGYYKNADVKHEDSSQTLLALKGFENSLKYMYGGYMYGNGMGDDSLDNLDALWAISSYNLGADICTGDALDRDDTLKKSNDPGTTKKTMYEWMMDYRNKLEKSQSNAAGDDMGPTIGNHQGYNGLGGRNNFACEFPKTVKGSSVNLISDSEAPGYGSSNPNISFASDEIDNSYYIALSCTHLGKEVNASDADGANTIYVTCLGLEPDYAVFAFTTANRDNDQNATAVYKFALEAIPAKLKKVSANTNFTENNPNYSLAGAVFDLYEDEDDATAGEDSMATFTTEANGESNEETVQAGELWLKETTAPKGFKKKEEPFTVTVAKPDGDEAQTFEVEDEPQVGYAKVQKVSGIKTITDGNKNYSLAGAVYGIYTDQACTKISKFTENGTEAKLTTKEDGSTDPLKHAIGTYYVKEITPSPGYVRDKAVHTVTIVDEQTATVNSTEIPKSGIFDLQKYDAETGAPVPLGGAKFVNAEFEVKYTDGGNITRTWVIKTDDKGYTTLDDAHKVSGDDFYKNSKGEVVVPLGTVTVKETKAPEGYHLNEDTFTINIEDNVDMDTETVTTKTHKVGLESKYTTSYVVTVPEKVWRGDVKWAKKEKRTEDSLSFIPFVIKSKSTGESHVVVADRSGQVKTVSTWNPHTYNTNGGDSIINKDGTPIVNENGLVTVENAWSKNGTWFYIDKEGNEAQDINDDIGALPYDDYEVTELLCEGNKDYQMISFNFTIDRDNQEFDIGTKTNTEPPSPPEIGTTALDKKTGSHITKSEETATVVDTVKYSGLEKGKEYTVTGYPVDKSTGERIPGIEAKTTFTPKSESGEVKLSFTFNSKELAGKTIVFFEYLYLGTDISGEPTAKHEDPNDPGQTIHIPEVKTTATDKATGSHTANAANDVTVVDRVEYKNLIPGEEYTVKGELMYKNGKSTKLTAEKVFTPTEPNGAVDLEFRFNASKVGGSSLVVFETLYDTNSKIVGEHKDINDKDQTVNYPHIGTTAIDKATDAHVGNAGENTVIVDTVKYKNLIPGQTYTLEGELMNRETDKSTGVTATTEFTPESASGEVKLEFTVDTSKLKGHTLVAFETLKMDTDGKETTVAEHKDIKDEAQSVHIPKVKTTAGDEKTGKKNITSGTVVDVVEYTNLVPGLKYTVEGVLMDKKTGKSTGITAKGSFTPKKANGKVKLKFKLNNKVNGKTLVVFETLKLNGKVVGEHKDINDKAQTVTVKKGTLGSPGKSGAPKTGQSIPWILVSLGILIALAGTYVIRNRRELFHK